VTTCIKSELAACVTIAAPDERKAATTSDTDAVLPNVGIITICLLRLTGNYLSFLMPR
tara:strand:- start:681 stop:854 length:174 start_codon:yes stop_codon:yes gene_type:complete